jgi:hypothetical protein
VSTVEFDDNGPSMTIDAFCMAETMSKAFYFNMQRLGLGPAVYIVPGTKLQRITAKARREWHERMANLSQQQAAKRERERRRQLARAAGKLAVQSPRHIVNQRRMRMALKLGKKQQSSA